MMADELLPKRKPDKTQRLVVINSIYHVKYSVRNNLDKLKRIQQFMIEDELLPKFISGKYQRLVIISGIYHVKYSIRNSLDKLKRIQQFIFTA